MKFILPFEDPNATELTLSGGKGASLAKLVQGDFPVPRGVVVTAEAYRVFMSADRRLPQDISALAFEDSDRLRRQCSAIRERLLRHELPADLQETLQAGTRSLLDEGPVSVRSSSTLEDLAGAAFAGQHDTFLNVHTPADVAECVKRCFVSLWEDRAVRYRHERGFGQTRMAMAVVIQSMVPAEVAGVAFSVNPVSGEADQVVVNAAWGLGETVVSGEGEVDQFVVDKTTGRILDQSIAEKPHEIIGTATGTETVEVPQERRHRACLGDEQLAELAKLCTRVERFYGFPQDVEWGWWQDRLYLLQSRPVTSFPARWTRDESAERFPSPMTPLTWDYTSEGFHESLAFSLDLMGLPTFEGKWFERFDGYIYGNQTAVQLFTSGMQVAFDDLDQLTALIPLLRSRYGWVQDLPVNWARDLDGYLLGLGRYGSVDLASLSEGELWTHLGDVVALGRSYFRPNIAISITQGVLHRMLFRLLALLAGPEEAAGFYDGLTAYCETKTGLVNRDIYLLYETARSDAKLTDLLRTRDRRQLWQDGALRDFPRFFEEFKAFLAAHGHREVEFDAYHPTWAGQPWVVLENVRLMLEQEEVGNPHDRNRELRLRQQQTELRLVELVPDHLQFVVAELIRLTRAYTALDDLEHYQTTRLTPIFRAALVEVGRRLAARGVVDADEDVFFLRKSTLTDLWEGRIGDSEARREALKNKEDFLRQMKSVPPHVWGEEADEVAADADLVGLAGSPGVAEGTVCIVRSVADFPHFRPGSVLVARTTNPAWTPLFYNACAVVTESGGPLSHGAVTAREVGLPAVMAVRGAMSELRDGERVRVHGTGGVVKRLERVS